MGEDSPIECGDHDESRSAMRLMRIPCAGDEEGLVGA